MATLEQFKQIRSSVSPEIQTELYGLLVQDLDAAVLKMIAIGAESNVSFTVDEVKSYLRELDEEDEFDDVELNEAALAAVSGGTAGSDGKSLWESRIAVLEVMDDVEAGRKDLRTPGSESDLAYKAMGSPDPGI